MIQDTLKIVTDSMDVLDNSGNVVATIAHKTTILVQLTGGIGWVCFVWAFFATIAHILLKYFGAKTDAIKTKTPFYAAVWVEENIAYMIIALFASVFFMFAVQEYWPPVTIWKSILVGLSAGSGIFNLWAIIPTWWNSFMNKVLPNNK